MSNIRLAFLDIAPTLFDFKVYRQPYDGKALNGDSNLRRYRLPESIDETNEQIWKDYIISCEERNGFEEFLCSSSFNSGLTLKYLFYNFVNCIRETSKIPPERYQILKKGFRSSIEFTVEEFREGKRIVFLFPYFLKATNQYGFIVGFKFDTNDGVPFSRKIQQLSLSLDKNFKPNKEFYIEKFNIIDNFIKSTLSYIEFKNSEVEFQIKQSFTELIPSRLEEKIFIFANNRTSSNQFLGIRNYGVLESLKKPVKFLFLFQERHKNFANDLYLSLLGKSYSETFSGLEKMFKIAFDKNSVEKIPLFDDSRKSINDALNSIYDREKELKSKSHICVIYIETNREESEEKKDNPYLYLKYHLTKKQIPLQTIDYTTHSKRDGLKYSVANIGLGIFAKLGGIPWKVIPKSENCLILGIGSAHKLNEEGEIVKYMAYSICIDSSGLYKQLEILTDDDNEVSHLEKLRNNLTLLLQKEEFKKYEKCALHIPSKIQIRELEAIRDVVSADKAREFRVLKVNNDNKFFGVAEHASRVPYEGNYIQLSKNEYLLWFQGLKKGVELVQGRIANPIHVEFFRINKTESSEQDYAYLQDLMNLSGANWRGFNSKIEPISIYYAKLFADYVQKFEKFEDFTLNDLDTNFPWFL